MTERGTRQVDRHNEVRRLEVVDHGEQRVREAENGARVLAGAPRDEGLVLQRIVGAMDYAVAVEYSE